MSELVIPLDPEILATFQESETDLIFDARTDTDTMYAVAERKLEEAGRVYWHAAAAMTQIYARDGDGMWLKLSDMTGWAESTLKSIYRTYKRMAPIAVPGISFWVHASISALPEPLREITLHEAADGCWTVEDTREKVAALKAPDKTQTLESEAIELQEDIKDAEFVALEDFKPDSTQTPGERLVRFLTYVYEALTLPGEKEECKHLMAQKWDRPAPKPKVKKVVGVSDWAEFCLAYPKRDGSLNKATAKPKFEGLVKAGTEAAAIIDGAKRYALWARGHGKEGTELIAQMTTWLNQKRWLEDYGQASVKTDVKRTKPLADVDYWIRPVDDHVERFIYGTTTPFDEAAWLEGRA